MKATWINCYYIMRGGTLVFLFNSITGSSGEGETVVVVAGKITSSVVVVFADSATVVVFPASVLVCVAEGFESVTVACVAGEFTVAIAVAASAVAVAVTVVDAGCNVVDFCFPSMVET